MSSPLMGRPLPRFSLPLVYLDPQEDRHRREQESKEEEEPKPDIPRTVGYQSNDKGS
jgi:hypothetical protein